MGKVKKGYALMNSKQEYLYFVVKDIDVFVKTSKDVDKAFLYEDEALATKSLYEIRVGQSEDEIFYLQTKDSPVGYEYVEKIITTKPAYMIPEVLEEVGEEIKACKRQA